LFAHAPVHINTPNAIAPNEKLFIVITLSPCPLPIDTRTHIAWLLKARRGAALQSDRNRLRVGIA